MKRIDDIKKNKIDIANDKKRSQNLPNEQLTEHISASPIQNTKELFMKNNNVQFLHNQFGEAIFAILPIETYKALLLGSSQETAEQVKTSPLLFGEGDNLSVRLPYGGPDAAVKIKDIISKFKNLGVNEMAVNARAQSLDKFSEDQQHTLDPVLRRMLPHSYQNTMQATKDVVDALVASGYFKLDRRKFPYSDRAVKSITLIK